MRFIDEPVVRLYQTGSYSGEVLEDAGLARPENQQDAEEAFIEISPELIPQVDAEYVVVALFADDAGVSADQQQQFQTNPLWGQLQGEIVRDLRRSRRTLAAPAEMVRPPEQQHARRPVMVESAAWHA